MIAPLIWPRIVAFLLKKEPTELANAPSETKTIENPSANWTAPLIFEIFEFLFIENMAKYPGTNGSTQGEKNDKAPKKKAIDAFISIN